MTHTAPNTSANAETSISTNTAESLFENTTPLNNYNSAQTLKALNAANNNNKAPVAHDEKHLRKSILAGIKEPTNGFGVSDALYFIPPLILSEGATSASNITVSSLTALMLISSATSRGIVEHAKLSGQNKILGMDIEKVENSPLILCGLAHIAISTVMAVNGENIHALMSGCFATGNILLAKPEYSKSIKEKAIDPFNNLIFKENASPQKKGNTAKTVTYAPLNASTYFAAGAGASGLLMEPAILAAAALPYLYAVSQIAKNTQTQFDQNLPFPPVDGKPVLALGGTLIAVAAANSVQHIFNQTSGAEILNTLSQAQNIETLCAIMGSAIVGITYHRLSKNFENDTSVKASILETHLTLPEKIQLHTDIIIDNIKSTATKLTEVTNHAFKKNPKKLEVNQLPLETSGEADFYYRPAI